MNQEARHYPAIVCFESAGSIWKRLTALQTGDSAGPEFLLTRAPGNAGDMLALCRRLAPALLVTGEEQLPQLPLGPGGIPVLLLSEKSDHAALESFFRRGCAGVLSSQVPDETLLRAVRSLFSGELWFPRALLCKIAQESVPIKSASTLTPRETEILRLVSDGISNREIAGRCLISRETVRWHIRSIYSKIGADSRETAIREAKRFLNGDA